MPLDLQRLVGPVQVKGTITDPLYVNTNGSDVTVDNAAGAAAVNIQDGGNSITVDGSVTAVPVAEVGDFYPIDVPEYTIGQEEQLRVDTAGNLMTRSAVLTDEGSFYEPFSGVVLNATEWTSSIGTGGSVTVADSKCNIISGTTSGSSTRISRGIDYSPLSISFSLSVSQRIANQLSCVEIADSDVPASVTAYARISFDGTDSTKVTLSSSSSTDTGATQTTTVTIPFAIVTSESLIYRIIHTGERVIFYVGRTRATIVEIGSFSTQIPNPYVFLYVTANITNTGVPATSTTMAIDTIAIANYNTLSIQGTTVGQSSITQDIRATGGSNSTTNLASGASFTGAAEDTLTVGSIQITVKADQNITVQCQQSTDGMNWDIVDSYAVAANVGDSRTITSTTSYARTVVTNTGAVSTTFFRLQTVLCPIANPLPRNIIKDATGQDRLAVSSVGTTVIIPDTDSTILEIAYNRTQVVQKGLTYIAGTRYTIPTGYNFEITGAEVYATDDNSQFSVRRLKLLGTFNPSTGVFTASSSYTLPEFGSGFFLEVTTVMGNINDQIYTVTYTNQAGVAGRTATVVGGLKLEKNYPVGTILPFVLQDSDFGVLSIQAVSTNLTNTGAVSFYGRIDYIDYANTVGLATTQISASTSNWFIREDNILALDVGVTKAGAGATAARKISVVGNLVLIPPVV